MKISEATTEELRDTVKSETEDQIVEEQLLALAEIIFETWLKTRNKNKP